MSKTRFPTEADASHLAAWQLRKSRIALDGAAIIREFLNSLNEMGRESENIAHEPASLIRIVCASQKNRFVGKRLVRVAR
jgi:hypothetical protein